MPTIITRTIDSSGNGDYTTFTAAEAAVATIGTSTNLVANDEAIVFEAVAGTYSESVNFQSSLTTDATRQVTYKAAAGSEHGGSLTQGVRIDGSTSTRDSFTALEGLVLYRTASAGTHRAENGEGITYRSVIANTGSGGEPFQALNVVSVRYENCVAHTTPGSGKGWRLDVLTRSGAIDLVNCTDMNPYRSIFLTVSNGYDAQVNIVNFLSLSPRGIYFLATGGSTYTLTGSNNFGGSTEPFPAALQAGSQTWTTTTDTDESTSPSTGSQVVYDATTGALVNSPNNDAVGEGTATGAPATDINGEDRIRGAYADPGAFTTELVTFTKTIDAGGGGDYTTFTAAEAAVGTLPTTVDLVKRNEAIVFEAEAGTYNENVNITSSLTADGTRQVTYKAAAGSEHGGVAGQGVHLLATTSAMSVYDAHVNIEGLSLAAPSYTLATQPLSVGFKADSCVIAATDRPAGSLRSSSTTFPSVFTNCIWESGLTGGQNIVVSNTADASYVFRNCTTMGPVNEQFSLRANGHALDVEFTNTLCLNLVGSAQTQAPSGGSITLTGSNNLGGSSNPFPVTLQAGSQTWTFSTDTQAASTGSQVIYDATTGALINVPGNDAVGEGTATGAPTTDINGEERVRDTHADPGAFTTQLRTITKSIDAAGGGDYTTFTAAEAAVLSVVTDTDMVKRNEAIVFEADAGDYSENLTFFTGSALTCDATRNVEWTHAIGAGHGGRFESGANIVGYCQMSEDFAVVDGLSVSPSSGSATYISNGAVGVTVRNVMSYSPTATAFRLEKGGTAAAPCVVENCVAKSDASRTFDIRSETSGVDSHWRIVNCTVFVPSGYFAFNLGLSSSDNLHVELTNNLVIGEREYFVFSGPTLTLTGSNNFGSGTNPFPVALQAGSQTWTTTTDTAAASTGSQVIYDATAGALVNVPGNDAIGVCGVTGIPATDINGEDRIRDTHVDPGAFTTQLRTITKSIDAAGGGDYSTFTAAEAAVAAVATDPDMVKRNEALVFEAEAGTYSGQFTLDSTLVCDATRNVTYKPASGSEHGGDKDSGVILTHTGLSLYLRDDFSRVEGLVCKSTSTNTGVGTIALAGAVVDSCIVVDDSGTGQSIAFQCNGSPDASNPFVIQNCLVMATGSRAIAIFGTGGYARLSNNTVLHAGYEQTYRSHNPTLTLEAYNNVGFGGAGVAFSTATVTGAGNISGSGGQWATSVAAGNQTWTSTTDTDESTSPATGSQVVYDAATGAMLNVPGNDAVGEGTATGAPTTDINGEDRIRGTYVDPGAFTTELVTFNRTIGATGRDYATFTAAEADVENISTDANLQQRNESIVFEADAGTYSESGANVFFTSTLVGDATRNVTYKPASGSEHGGSAAAGVRCIYSAAIINDSFVTFDGLVFSLTDTNGVQPRGDEGIVLRNLIIDQSALSASFGVLATGNCGSPSAPMVVENCRVLAQSEGIRLRRTSAVTTDGSVRVFNNTVSATGSSALAIYTLNSSTGTLAAEVTNNLVLDADLDFATSGTTAITGSNNFGPRVNASFAFPAALQGSPYPITATTNTSPGSGNWAIYDATTGALINVPDNSVIGGGTATGAPATDINGEDRIRDTHADPGAFTTQLRTITKSIDAAGGGDYTTFTAAEAAVTSLATDTDMVKRNEAVVFEAVAGTYSESVTFQSSLTTDATRQVTYKPAVGAEHRGVPSTGVVLQSTTGINARDDHMTLRGLCYLQTSTAVTTSNGVGLLFDQIIYEYAAGVQYGTFMECQSALFPSRWQNSVLLAQGVSGGDRRGFLASHNNISGYVDFVNCTVVAEDPAVVGFWTQTFGTGTCQLNLVNCVRLGASSGKAYQVSGSGTTVTGSNNFGGSTNPFPAALQAGSQTWTTTTDADETTSPSTGSQVVYDSSTGALVNSPNNDAVGEGTATGAPTTDINGEGRIRDTHADPGAFTTQLRTITKSIDAAGGGDYTTFTAAEAAVGTLPTDADMVQRNEALVFEAEAGTYSENVTFQSSLTTDATRQVTYKAAAGSEHGGDKDSGVRLSGTGFTLNCQATEKFLRFKGIVIRSSAAFGYVTVLRPEGLKLSRCIVEATGAGGRPVFITSAATSGNPVVVENSVIISADYQACYIFCNTADSYGKVVNCTLRVLGGSQPAISGIETGGFSVYPEVINCLVLNEGTGGAWSYFGSSASGSNNFGGSTDPFPAALQAGSQTWTFTTDADESTSPSTGSQVVYDSSTGALVNSPNNDAVGAGTATGAPTTDINGEDRIREGSYGAFYADPGAFTTDRVDLGGTVGVGKDYATYLAAEASTGGYTSLPKSNVRYVFTATPGETISESNIIVISNASEAGPNHNVRFQCLDKTNRARRLQPTTADALRIREGFFEWDGIDIETGSRGILFETASGVDTVGTRFSNCVLDTPAVATELSKTQLAENQGSAAHPQTFENVLTTGTRLLSHFVATAAHTGGAYFVVRNCTRLNDTTTNTFLAMPSATTTGMPFSTIEVYNCLDLSPGAEINAEDYLGSGNVGCAGANNGSSFTTYGIGVNYTRTTDPLAASTGSQVIYDATTGAMLNVPGNDAVGVGIATEAPTTDITGEDRIRDTHADPGAFTTQLRTITKSIDAAGGGDYTTFTAAEAAVGTLPTAVDMVQRNEALVFEAEAGTYVEILNVNSTLVSDATRNVTYRCADRAARPVIGNGTQNTTVRMRDDYTHFDGIDSFDTIGAAFKLFDSQVGIVIENCEATSDGAGVNLNKSGANIGSAAAPCVVRNVVTKAQFGVKVGGADVFVEVFNCTFLPGTTSPAGRTNYEFFATGSSACKLINCIVLDSRADRQFGSTATVTGSNNIGVLGGVSGQLFSTNGVGSEKTPTTNTSPGAGDWSIYDATTGALVNVPDNAAVGEGTAAEASATDINGEDRIRDTHADPGAFTTQLRTITKSIDAAGGGDYTTFTAAEAAVSSLPTDADMVKRNEALVFEAEAGTYSESVTFQSSLTTDATRQVTYKAAAGSEHGGDSAAGVRVTGSSNTFSCRDDFMRLEQLAVETTGAFNYALVLQNQGQVAEACIAESVGVSCFLLGQVAAGTAPQKLTNSVAICNSSFGVYCFHPGIIQVTNCTVIQSTGTAFRISDSGTTLAVDLTNDVVLSDGLLPAYVAFGTPTITGSNNFGGAANPFPAAIQAGSQTWTATTDTDESTSPSTGSQVVYDATTGALVNVPGNDAVGEGTSTGAPATDINGEARIRDTHADPGAFTAQLRTITKSIDAAGGGDYTTFTAAEAAVAAVATDPDMVQRNEAVVFEAEAGTYSENPFFSSSLTTDATRQVTYKPAAGSEHGGDPASGVILQGQININSTEQYLLFDGLVSKQPTGVGAPCVEIGGDGHVIRSCVIVQAGDRAAVRTGLVREAGQLSPNVIENCVIDTTASGSRSCIEIFGRTGGTFTHIVNCTGTAHINKPFIESAYFGVTTKILNCLSLGTRSYTESSAATLAGSNNFGGAANPFPTALQAGSQTWTFTTDTNETTSPSTGSQVVYDDETGRLYDVPGNDAWQILTDLTGVPATDIDGITRSASGYNPGAFEETGNLGAEVLLTAAAASLAALGTSTFSATAALAAPYEFGGTAGTLFSGAAALTTRTLESSGNSVQLFFGSSALEVHTAFGGSGGSIINSAAVLALSPVEAASTGLSLFSTQADLTVGWAGVIRDDGLVRGSAAVSLAATRFGGRNVELPPHTGYMALAFPQISLIAAARVRAGQEEVRMHAAQASISAQGGMINLPTHSRGAGTIISY